MMIIADDEMIKFILNIYDAEDCMTWYCYAIICGDDTCSMILYIYVFDVWCYWCRWRFTDDDQDFLMTMVMMLMMLMSS